MFLAVKLVYADLAAVLDLLPNFTDFITLFTNAIKSIQRLTEEQLLDFKGKTDLKNSSASDLISKTMGIIRRMVAYTTINYLYELEEEINYSESELNKSTDDDLRAICQVVHDKASNELTNVADFGITQDMLDAQQTAIGDYSTNVSAPREGIMNRKYATAALQDAFKEATSALAPMDKLVSMLKDSDKETYKRYMNARIIVDYGKSKKDLEYTINGRIIDFESGLPLAGVSVAVVGTTIGVITGIDGTFPLTFKSPGEYTLRCEKEGYKAILNVVSVIGETAEVEIELERMEEKSL